MLEGSAEAVGSVGMISHYRRPKILLDFSNCRRFAREWQGHTRIKKSEAETYLVRCSLLHCNEVQSPSY
jgi:hypothetical protein